MELGTRIARTRIVDGVVVPAFIRNLSHHFVNLQVYADGLVDCWELHDLPLFREKLASGWVTPSVPDQGQLSLFGLAAWTIADAIWMHTPESLFAHVSELVRALNPRMENLHDCHGRTTETIGKANFSILGAPTERPVRFQQPDWGTYGTRIYGDSITILVREGDTHYVADLRAFADGTIELGRLPTPRTLTLVEVKAEAKAKRLLSEVPLGTRVTVHGLGSFVVAQADYTTKVRDLLAEIPDLMDTGAGRPDSVQRCRAAFAAYTAKPTVRNREALRAAYYAVPTHRRMFVGDMDSKDSEVRAAINPRGRRRSTAPSGARSRGR